LLLAIKGQRGREWASITELAEALQVRHHAAVGLVDRSERAGLVTRNPDPDDRRQVRVMLTGKGETLLARLSERNLTELRTLRQARWAQSSMRSGSLMLRRPESMPWKTKMAQRPWRAARSARPTSSGPGIFWQSLPARQARSLL